MNSADSNISFQLDSHCNGETSLIGLSWGKAVAWAKNTGLEYTVETNLFLESAVALYFDDFIVVGKPDGKVTSLSSRLHWSHDPLLDKEKADFSFQILFKSLNISLDEAKCKLETFMGKLLSDGVFEFKLYDETDAIIVIKQNFCSYFRLEKEHGSVAKFN